MAAIRALESLTRPSVVRLHTDSSYLRNGVTSWLAGWKRNGWRTASKQPVKNEDLWRRLDAAAAQHDVQWLWVKGHAGDPGNERADALANRGDGRGSGSVAPVRGQGQTKLALARQLPARASPMTGPPRIHLNGSPATQDDIPVTGSCRGGGS